MPKMVPLEVISVVVLKLLSAVYHPFYTHKSQKKYKKPTEKWSILVRTWDTVWAYASALWDIDKFIMPVSRLGLKTSRNYKKIWKKSTDK